MDSVNELIGNLRHAKGDPGPWIPDLLEKAATLILSQAQEIERLRKEVTFLRATKAVLPQRADSNVRMIELLTPLPKAAKQD